MKKFNIKRTFFTFIILAALSPIALTFQNFSRLEIEKDSAAFNDELTSALKTSEDEHQVQRLAVTANTFPIKKKSHLRKPSAIYDGNSLGDAEETIISESSVGK
jgi:hypothetical protein